MGIGKIAKKKPSYPYVGQHRGDRLLLVLFVSQNTGWVVDDESDLKVGYLCDAWEEKNFVAIEYSVTFNTE